MIPKVYKTILYIVGILDWLTLTSKFKEYRESIGSLTVAVNHDIVGSVIGCGILLILVYDLVAPHVPAMRPHSVAKRIRGLLTLDEAAALFRKWAKSIRYERDLDEKQLSMVTLNYFHHFLNYTLDGDYTLLYSPKLDGRFIALAAFERRHIHELLNKEVRSLVFRELKQPVPRVLNRLFVKREDVSIFWDRTRLIGRDVLDMDLPKEPS